MWLMAFNRETSQRQSKLTKQLNIQMIKKGGGSLQTFEQITFI